VLLGWFGFVGGEGPTEVVVTGNDLLRCRTASIRYDGNPNGTDGFLTVAGNRISRAGEFPQQLPPPGSQQPSPNAGNGIVVVGIRDVTVENNVVSDGYEKRARACPATSVAVFGSFTLRELFALRTILRVTAAGTAAQSLFRVRASK